MSDPIQPPTPPILGVFEFAHVEKPMTEPESPVKVDIIQHYTAGDVMVEAPDDEPATYRYTITLEPTYQQVILTVPVPDGMDPEAYRALTEAEVFAETGRQLSTRRQHLSTLYEILGDDMADFDPQAFLRELRGDDD